MKIYFYITSILESTHLDTETDLPLYLGVFKHGVPLTKWGGGGGASSCHHFFYDGFLFMWCNFNFEGVLFRSDSRHNDRVVSLPPFQGQNKGPNN